MSPSGGLLATCGLAHKNVRLWDVATGARRSGGDAVHPEPVTAVAFSANDALVTSCKDKCVRVFPVDGVKVSAVKSLSLGSPVNSVCCCPVNRPKEGTLAAAVSDGFVVLWDTVTGVLLRSLVWEAG